YLHSSATRSPIYPMLTSNHAAGSRLPQQGSAAARDRRADAPELGAEAYLHLRTLPGDQAQDDWADFGTLKIGRAGVPRELLSDSLKSAVLERRGDDPRQHDAYQSGGPDRFAPRACVP